MIRKIGYSSNLKSLWYKSTNGVGGSKALQLSEIYFGKPAIIEAELLNQLYMPSIGSLFSKRSIAGKLMLSGMQVHNATATPDYVINPYISVKIRRLYPVITGLLLKPFNSNFEFKEAHYSLSILLLQFLRKNSYASQI